VHSVFNEEEELQHEFGFSTIYFTMTSMTCSSTKWILKVINRLQHSLTYSRIEFVFL